MLDVTLPVDELTKLRDQVRADPDRLPLSLALAFDMGVKAALERVAEAAHQNMDHATRDEIDAEVRRRETVAAR